MSNATVDSLLAEVGNLRRQSEALSLRADKLEGLASEMAALLSDSPASDAPAQTRRFVRPPNDDALREAIKLTLNGIYRRNPANNDAFHFYVDVLYALMTRPDPRATRFTHEDAMKMSPSIHQTFRNRNITDPYKKRQMVSTLLSSNTIGKRLFYVADRQVGGHVRGLSANVIRTITTHLNEATHPAS